MLSLKQVRGLGRGDKSIIAKDLKSHVHRLG